VIQGNKETQCGLCAPRWLSCLGPGLVGGARELAEVYSTEQEALEAAKKIVQDRLQRYCEEWTIRVVRHGGADLSRPVRLLLHQPTQAASLACGCAFR
jgi:hypothetical protein